MEGACMGLFLLSACAFTALLEHPASMPCTSRSTIPWLRRALMGLAMGITAVLLVTSPLGKRSGAHMNPGRDAHLLDAGQDRDRGDALFYIARPVQSAERAGCGGGRVADRAAAAALGGELRRHPAGALMRPLPAFAAESADLGRAHGRCPDGVEPSDPLTLDAAGWPASLVALYITLEAPISGMSMNPARTLGSAVKPDPTARCGSTSSRHRWP